MMLGVRASAKSPPRRRTAATRHSRLGQPQQPGNGRRIAVRTFHFDRRFDVAACAPSVFVYGDTAKTVLKEGVGKQILQETYSKSTKLAR